MRLHDHIESPARGIWDGRAYAVVSKVTTAGLRARRERRSRHSRSPTPGLKLCDTNVRVLAQHRDEGASGLGFGVDANTPLAVICADDGSFPLSVERPVGGSTWMTSAP